ncbi:putative LRR receptor-like serine/threonine-protein kinase [Heracleum sosnowskyi]|uniref:LRR receptor-like serine/threonine-protein kinase n=1 Tax=Heracleum sosnowskyi TaxID=360622 RepID=A0AAD8JHM1_9APIA|nr:putative LRR receptor-like serine/threonine-protein kinase [Heracleum sosnowskyi]
MGVGRLCVILLVTLFFRPAMCQQPNTDGYFLLEFLKNMGAKATQVHNISNHVCSWPGVFCDAKQESVVKLVASGFGLSGLISDNTIGKLRSLQYLDLSSNNITNLPSDFWSLGSLKILNLSFNQISENLPSNIGNFGLLESLDISFNKFSGNIPQGISSLASLQVLNLQNNRFQSSIPQGILNCKSLVSMDFSRNQLNGSLPEGFASAFPKLKSLNLAGNEIHGRGSDFSGMVSVTFLNISCNLFQGSVVDIFGGPLEVIDLSHNQFRGHISQVNFRSRFNWSHLVYLDLSENQLSGFFFNNLNEAQNLVYLNLAYNRFSGQKFLQIDDFPNLEYLNLSATNLIGIIPVEIQLLSNLRAIDLSKNHLRSQIPPLSSKRLQTFDVSYNNLTGNIPLSILDKLPWMDRFNFSYNRLTLCATRFSSETLKTAFIGLSSSCPIAANPSLYKRKTATHRGLELSLVLALLLVCLLVGLLTFAFGCRRKARMWAVKQYSYKEEQNISGPFSFQTDSTTWVADVKLATSVPVVMFEKPLLKFTFADLLSATSNFDRGTLLAEGRFGPVYKGFLQGGIHVAVKVLVHESTMTDHEAARELEYLGGIRHRNLVPLTGYCLAGEQRIAIYDYMENGNLENLLHDLPPGVQTTENWSADTCEEHDNSEIQNVGSEELLTTWRFRYKIALGTARALAFLHHGCSPPIVHRDVNSSSVYLDMNLEPRLSDFGLAKICGHGLENEIAHRTAGYMPPELLEPESGSPRGVTPKSDVYRFGIVLFELVTGKKPGADTYPDNEATLVSWVRGLVKKNEGSRAIDPKIRGIEPESHFEEALKIGYLCTAALPSKRPSMQQVVGLLKDIEPSMNY